jgi:lipid-A-disaccharide synthase
MSKKIFLVAGEPSGDLHASRLAREIKKIDSSVTLTGIGGANMASEGVELLHRTDELAIIGLSDILRHFKKIKEMFTSFLAKVEEEKPGLVILVDYPGFNLRLAKALKKRGVKILYYISPQIWAWGKWRIKKIKERVEKILVLFKFEADMYKKADVSVEFVGHPLLDIAKPSCDKDTIRKRLQLDEARKTITLLPGSRKREIDALLPVMVETSRKLYEKSKDIQFIVVRSHNLDEEIFEKYLKELKVPYRVVVNTGSELYDYLSVSDLAIVASGTVTLECAIMNIPMIITYKVTLLNALLMKPFLRTSLIGLVNVLAGKKIVPEFIQYDLTSGNVFREADEILFDPGRSNSIRKELANIKSSLGKEGASHRAALSAINLLKK